MAKSGKKRKKRSTDLSFIDKTVSPSSVIIVQSGGVAHFTNNPEPKENKPPIASWILFGVFVLAFLFLCIGCLSEMFGSSAKTVGVLKFLTIASAAGVIIWIVFYYYKKPFAYAVAVAVALLTAVAFGHVDPDEIVRKGVNGALKKTGLDSVSLNPRPQDSSQVSTDSLKSKDDTTNATQSR